MSVHAAAEYILQHARTSPLWDIYEELRKDYTPAEIQEAIRIALEKME